MEVGLVFTASRAWRDGAWLWGGMGWSWVEPSRAFPPETIPFLCPNGSILNSYFFSMKDQGIPLPSGSSDGFSRGLEEV